MPKIRFLETRTVKDGSGFTYQAGQVYEVSEDGARHWLRRNVAVLVDPSRPMPIDPEPDDPPAQPPEGSVGPDSEPDDPPDDPPAQQSRRSRRGK